MLGVYINSVFGFKWPDHNWNIDFSRININLNGENSSDQLVIKSIDAGLFNKDIEKHIVHILILKLEKCISFFDATIKNYSKRNTATQRNTLEL